MHASAQHSKEQLLSLVYNRKDESRGRFVLRCPSIITLGEQVASRGWG